MVNMIYELLIAREIGNKIITFFLCIIIAKTGLFAIYSCDKIGLNMVIIADELIDRFLIEPFLFTFYEQQRVERIAGMDPFCKANEVCTPLGKAWDFGEMG